MNEHTWLDLFKRRGAGISQNSQLKGSTVATAGSLGQLGVPLAPSKLGTE